MGNAGDRKSFDEWKPKMTNIKKINDKVVKIMLEALKKHGLYFYNTN